MTSHKRFAAAARSAIVAGGIVMTAPSFAVAAGFTADQVPPRPPKSASGPAYFVNKPEPKSSLAAPAPTAPVGQQIVVQPVAPAAEIVAKDAALDSTGDTVSPPASSGVTLPAEPAAGAPAASMGVAAPAPSPNLPNLGAPPIAAAPALPADPVLSAVLVQLAPVQTEDGALLREYYASAQSPLWTIPGELSPRGKLVVTELSKADDWGLFAASYDVPKADIVLDSAEMQVEAEVKIAIAALTYGRHARGGRINPRSLSPIIDRDTAPFDAKAVWAKLAAAENPDAILRGLHPQHPQFMKLREALVAARAPEKPAEPEPSVAPGLDVKLPSRGPALKPGSDHPDVALLRKRLNVSSTVGAENIYDNALLAAVQKFQQEKGVGADGIVGARSRAALNGDVVVVEKRSPERDLQRLIVNMERWRWMPEDLGAVHVINNIPEFMTRVYRGNEQILEERIVVGLPSWPTPQFSASMEFVIFQPTWGVPDGIKNKELLPKLRKYASQNSFFDFFGGGTYASRVLAGYNLKMYQNGRQVDPNSVDWSRANINNYTFTQPSGGDNVLGNVKFRFPNKHDVYMHDTMQKHLFANSRRAESHGCIRVQNPRRFAEVILAEDKGWDIETVGRYWNGTGGGSEVTLDRHIPVHMTYFTARIDDDGKIQTYSDVYGHDGRVASALFGRSMQFDPPPAYEQQPDAEGQPVASTTRTRQQREARNDRRSNNFSNDLSDAISGLFAN